MGHVHGRKALVLCRQRRPRLDLDIYPYLPKARVETKLRDWIHRRFCPPLTLRNNGLSRPVRRNLNLDQPAAKFRPSLDQGSTLSAGAL